MNADFFILGDAIEYWLPSWHLLRTHQVFICLTWEFTYCFPGYSSSLYRCSLTAYPCEKGGVYMGAEESGSILVPDYAGC
jgi:hypothetical protein